MNARAQRTRLLQLRATSNALAPREADLEDRLAALRSEYYQIRPYRDRAKLERRLREIEIAVRHLCRYADEFSLAILYFPYRDAKGSVGGAS